MIERMLVDVFSLLNKGDRVKLVISITSAEAPKASKGRFEYSFKYMADEPS